jgi:hypothetical protein
MLNFFKCVPVYLFSGAVPDYEQAITLDESVPEVYIKLADT